MMLRNKSAIPGGFARSVVVGVEDCQTGGILHKIYLRVVDIKPNLNSIFAGNQRRARYFANKDLLAHHSIPGAVALEETMCRENPLGWGQAAVAPDTA